MATVTAKPGVSVSSAQSASRVSQDINGRSNPNWRSSFGSSSASVASDLTSAFNKYAAMVKANAAENNAWSAQQAQINRDWQERMSNTAHQREVNDLQAAGLNPVLSAMNGNGAATTSGATASTDTSANSALAGILGSILQSQVSLENQRLSAQTNLAVAEKYNAMSKYTAELGAQTQLSTANISAATSRWVAQLQSQTSISNTQAQTAASKVVASIQAAAQRYGYELSSWTSQQVAQVNGQINKELKQMDIQSQFDLKEQFPSNAWQFGGNLWSEIQESGLSGAINNIWNGVSGNSARQNAFKEWKSKDTSTRGSGFR